MSVTFAPDLGQADLDAIFTSALAVTVELAALTPIGSGEGDTRIKGLADLRLTIDGTVYEIPISIRRQIRVKNGGVVRWESTGGSSGLFRYFRSAPPVFLEDEA